VPPELLLPEYLTGGGLIAECHAGIIDAEQEIVRYDHGGDIRGPLCVVPGDVGLRDITPAIGPDREQDLFGPTAADENQSSAFAVDRRGDEFLRGAVNLPELLAGVGIETGHAPVAALDQLSAAGQLTDQWSTVADSLISTADAPECLSVVAAQSDQEGIAFAVAVDNDLIFEQHGLIAEPPLAGMCPRSDQPELLPAGEVMRGHNDVVADAEGDVDPLPIGGRRTRGMTVLLVDLLQRPLQDGPLPEDLSGVAVQAEKHALLCRRQGGDGQDAIAPDDRGRMPLAGKFCLPERARWVPFSGDVLLRTRAVAARATPDGPGFGLGRGGRVGQ